MQRRKSTPPSPPNKTKNQTKEEELCGKLLKKTPARRYPVFTPDNLSGFQNAAVTAFVSRHREIGTYRIQIIKDFADTLPDFTLDTKKVATVLDAIVLNAIEAMSERGGDLIVRTKMEELTFSDFEHDPGDRSGKRQRARATAVMIEIEDTGRGIPPEALQAIFDPFFTTKETGRGTGLGLTVCRKILELHGGSISVSNRQGGGVGVRILLPA